jgi:hypothetical protein
MAQLYRAQPTHIGNTTRCNALLSVQHLPPTVQLPPTCCPKAMPPRALPGRHVQAAAAQRLLVLPAAALAAGLSAARRSQARQVSALQRRSPGGLPLRSQLLSPLAGVCMSEWVEHGCVWRAVCLTRCMWQPVDASCRPWPLTGCQQQMTYRIQQDCCCCCWRPAPASMQT